MAGSKQDLMEDELTCPICLEVFSEPKMLYCGHNFCSSCLENVLRKQEEKGEYSCPECSWEFQDKPTPKRNFKLANIVEMFEASQRPSSSEPRKTPGCDFCSAAAEKTCLTCEMSFCSQHLKPHLDKPALQLHRLLDPSGELTGLKCAEHGDVFKLYCSDCRKCVCTLCVVEGEHKTHCIKSLKNAQHDVKKALGENLPLIVGKLEIYKNRLQQQQEEECQLKKHFEGIKRRKSGCFEKLQLHMQEYKTQMEAGIACAEDQACRDIETNIQRLTQEHSDLQEIRTCLENVVAETDPFQCIQGFLSVEERVDKAVQEQHGELGATPLEKNNPLRDCELKFEKFRSEIEKLHQILQSVKLRIQGFQELTFDPNTASPKLMLSEDRRTVRGTKESQPRPDHPERFDYHPQVLCTQRFTSGCHCWEVEVVESGNWAVGLANKTMPRKGWDNAALLGYNADSWCVYSVFSSVAVWHNNQREVPLHTAAPRRVRLLLDYDSGELSFYHMATSPILLYRFTTKFTQVVCPAFWAGPGTKLTLHEGSDL
ncbi:E3 ubiquitin/ISG15 ligase TRIM25-like [Acipenser ruthenus]|uniref:E3 ubiquitin/ISG15 ligase TRIM25-like n=1 Tax=Acipenser ruthenus TaxID=7906 RepID=UPI002742124D|nr:E3 ubiquitin/ISG15 ligase TRIM25-like [Acipenser ruthenus]